MSIEDCTSTCLYPADCSSPFSRVRIRPAILGGTHIEWTLGSNFSDPTPHTFQLQVGTTASATASDWTNVGASANNVTFLIDNVQRIFGKTQWTHYRVVLTTSVDTYVSPAQHCWGDLSFKNWRLLQARTRQWSIALRQTPRGQEGFLLKRKLVGTAPIPVSDNVVDWLTGDINQPDNDDTLGTDFVGGYHLAIPCIYAGLSPLSRRESLDTETRGTVNDDMRVSAVFLAVPQLDSRDVWVDKDSDFRWEVHKIAHVEDIAGVPIVVSAELRLLPFSHPAYKVDLI